MFLVSIDKKSMIYRVPDRMKIEHIEANEAGYPERIRVSDGSDSIGSDRNGLD